MPDSPLREPGRVDNGSSSRDGEMENGFIAQLSVRCVVYRNSSGP